MLFFSFTLECYKMPAEKNGGTERKNENFHEEGTDSHNFMPKLQQHMNFHYSKKIQPRSQIFSKNFLGAEKISRFSMDLQKTSAKFNFQPLLQQKN